MKNSNFRIFGVIKSASKTSVAITFWAIFLMMSLECLILIIYI